MAKIISINKRLFSGYSKRCLFQEDEMGIMALKLCTVRSPDTPDGVYGVCDYDVCPRIDRAIISEDMER